jgi:hypothetical protein
MEKKNIVVPKKKCFAYKIIFALGKNYGRI